MTATHRLRISWKVLYLQIAVLVLLVYPFTAETFRDNDQATLISGSWQLAHGLVSFWHAPLYIYDKQWGTFLLLSLAFRLFRPANPVLLGNVLQVVVISIAWIALAFRTGRTRCAAWPLLLPILVSPALVLYMPYLGTTWLSLAFLLLAFHFAGYTNRRQSKWLALFFVAIAAACRGDVVLTIPALVLSQSSRTSLMGLLRRPLVWLFGISALLPVLFGRLIDANHNPYMWESSFRASVFTGFFIFGFTIPLLVLLLAAVAAYLSLAVRRRRFAFFYVALSVAPVIPLLFYAPQLFSLRYFYTTIASLLFVVTSRRSLLLYRFVLIRHPLTARYAGMALVTLSLVPWFIGLKLPTSTHPQLTFTSPTRFPTSDGRFPMGGYLAFASEVLWGGRLQIDHNQKIWISAASTRYDSCRDGFVPLQETGMVDFLELAVRLQGKVPKVVKDPADSPCGIVFADARSILRGNITAKDSQRLLHQTITFVSEADTGQPILRIDYNNKPSTEALLLTSLLNVFKGRDLEIHLTHSRNRCVHMAISIVPAIEYVIFSGRGDCVASLDCLIPKEIQRKARGILQAEWPQVQHGSETLRATCSGEVTGWARATLPAYMEFEENPRLSRIQ